MHILILASLYPSSIRPTTGIFVQDQVLSLKNAGHQVGVFIAPRLYETLEYIRQNKKFPSTIEVVNDAESTYRLHSLWVPRFFPLISAQIYKQAGKSAFTAYCKLHGTPDIIHAHNTFYGGHMAVQIAANNQIPIVLTEHSTNYLRGRIFLPGQHRIVSQTLNQVDAPLAVGQVLADYLNDRYHPQTRVKTIPNVVDTDYFTPGTKEDTFTLAAVGQLTKRKRFDLLITAFAEAFRDKPIRLSIGGGGAIFDNLKNLVTTLNMDSQIELLGHLSREQVRNLFQRTHVVVSSSNIETFGVTLIEAMSCGNPVIATRSGGPEQFINETNGILIPVNDKESLIDALQRMYTHYNSYDNSLIRQDCIAQFGSQAVAEKLEAIYRSLLNR